MRASPGGLKYRQFGTALNSAGWEWAEKLHFYQIPCCCQAGDMLLEPFSRCSEFCSGSHSKWVESFLLPSNPGVIVLDWLVEITQKLRVCLHSKGRVWPTIKIKGPSGSRSQRASWVQGGSCPTFPSQCFILPLLSFSVSHPLPACITSGLAILGNGSQDVVLALRLPFPPEWYKGKLLV